MGIFVIANIFLGLLIIYVCNVPMKSAVARYESRFVKFKQHLLMVQENLMPIKALQGM